MNLSQLLFSFKGRIQRLYWWVTIIAVGAAAGALTTLLDVAARASGYAVFEPDTHQIEPTGLFGAAVVAVGLANLWVNFALSVKRLHDRNRTGWWLLVQFGVLILAVIAMATAMVIGQEKDAAEYVNGQYLVYGYFAAGALGIVALIISIWLFVEIGCLRGPGGPNRFGPDPLGQTQADASI